MSLPVHVVNLVTLQTNPHQLTVVMSPDEQFEQERQKQEQEKLDSLIENLQDADREQIYRKGTLENI